MYQTYARPTELILSLYAIKFPFVRFGLKSILKIHARTHSNIPNRVYTHYIYCIPFRFLNHIPRHLVPSKLLITRLVMHRVHASFIAFMKMVSSLYSTKIYTLTQFSLPFILGRSSTTVLLYILLLGTDRNKYFKFYRYSNISCVLFTYI